MGAKSILILQFIQMHPDINCPIHLAMPIHFNKIQVEETVEQLFQEGYVDIIDCEFPSVFIRRPILTEKGRLFLASIN